VNIIILTHQPTPRAGRQVNFILKMQGAMLRDVAATDVYYNALLAHRASAAASAAGGGGAARPNFAGPRIGGADGRALKLSEARPLPALSAVITDVASITDMAGSRSSLMWQSSLIWRVHSPH
jgi:hypothetical protein